MGLAEALQEMPHLWSPAALAAADMPPGKFSLPPHLDMLNRELMDVGLKKTERLMVNLPFQHGKSVLSSHYFPASLLLLWPDTRIILAAHEERFATQFGSRVKETIEKFGPQMGVCLKQDSQAKDEWVIEAHGGGMTCRGMQGALQGRPADIFLIDDPIKDAEQALSEVTLERHWDWFQTVAYSRLGPTAPIVIISTRWVKGDLCGRLLADAKDSGENWRVVKFKAIAEADDVLGRAPGTPLWPERVPLKRFEVIRKRNHRWFRACWQQEPEDAEGTWFKPKRADGSWAWPLYKDLSNIWSVPGERGRRLIEKRDAIIMITVDWAWSKKQSADYTAMGVFALTVDGCLLILDVVNDRFRPEELAPALARICQVWKPNLVAVETGHPTLAQEYRRHRDIPPVRWLEPGSRNKLQRALPAINMAESKPGRLLLPEEKFDWVEPYCSQMASFTGDDNSSEHDDMVDMTSWACMLAEEMRPVSGHGGEESFPDVLTPGKSW